MRKTKIIDQKSLQNLEKHLKIDMKCYKSIKIVKNFDKNGNVDKQRRMEGLYYNRFSLKFLKVYLRY